MRTPTTTRTTTTTTTTTPTINVRRNYSIVTQSRAVLREGAAQRTCAPALLFCHALLVTAPCPASGSGSGSPRDRIDTEHQGHTFIPGSTGVVTGAAAQLGHHRSAPFPTCLLLAARENIFDARMDQLA